MLKTKSFCVIWIHHHHFDWSSQVSDMLTWCNALLTWNWGNIETGNPCCTMCCPGSWPRGYKGTHLYGGLQSWENCTAVKMSTTEMFNQPFKHYLVLDFESTCQEGVRIDPQEIIEFPCLLVGADDLCLVDQVPSFTLLPFQVFCFLKFFQRRFQFHEYVKPVGKPLLTDFCTGLTGITQDMIKVLSPGVCPLIINTWDWGDARQISVSYMKLFSSNLIGNFITGQGYFSWCTVALRFLVCIEKYLISALDQLEMFWKGTNLMALTPPTPPLWPVGSGIWSQCYLNNASIQARRFSE